MAQFRKPGFGFGGGAGSSGRIWLSRFLGKKEKGQACSQGTGRHHCVCVWGGGTGVAEGCSEFREAGEKDLAVGSPFPPEGRKERPAELGSPRSPMSLLHAWGCSDSAFAPIHAREGRFKWDKVGSPPLLESLTV